MPLLLGRSIRDLDAVPLAFPGRRLHPMFTQGSPLALNLRPKRKRSGDNISLLGTPWFQIDVRVFEN
jgi:hypothetical protein